MAKLLIFTGANVEAVAQWHWGGGVRPLHLAAEGGRADLVRCLCQYGAAVDAADELKYTALHYAAERNEVAAVQVCTGAVWVGVGGGRGGGGGHKRQQGRPSVVVDAGRCGAHQKKVPPGDLLKGPEIGGRFYVHKPSFGL